MRYISLLSYYQIYLYDSDIKELIIFSLTSLKSKMKVLY